VNAAVVPDPWVPRPHRITAVQQEAADTVSLELSGIEGPTGRFEPGQFNMLYVFGVGEIAISLSGDPDDHGRWVHTVRSVGAVSAAITRLARGDIVGVRGPFGSAWPLNQALQRDLVIVAGGLGLAPLRPAIHHVLHRRPGYRRVVILIGMRSAGEILYRAQLERWREALDIELEVTVDRPDGAWRGHVGVVPTLIGRLGLDPAHTVALVCGPEIMMRFSANALCDAGVAPANIHLSMERNMKCALGLCGRCQFGPTFICKDGPVLPLARIAGILALREV